MPTSDETVTPLALELLECLDQEISKVPSPPQYVQLRTGGTVAHLLSENEDECCAGLAWVRVVQIFPSSGTFPVQDTVPVPNGTMGWAIEFELGAIRCAPSSNSDRIPTAAENAAAFFAVQDDAAAMRRALCCFIDIDPRRVKLTLPGAWTPLDIQGGCMGGVMTLTVRVPACDCAEAGPVSS